MPQRTIGTSYSHDNNGNLTGETTGGVTRPFAYDSFGRRSASAPVPSSDGERKGRLARSTGFVKQQVGEQHYVMRGNSSQCRRQEGPFSTMLPIAEIGL